MITFVVLHRLRLKGVAPIEALIDNDGPNVGSAVANELARLAAEGLVRERTTGRLTGWLLTPAGESHSNQLLRTELESSGHQVTVEACYQDFLPLNRRVLQVCSDWQVRTVDGHSVRNDHEDVEWDRAVIERLATLHQQAQPILARLATALPRFNSYEPRLSRAVTQVVAGDVQWFTAPGIDSFHTIWFELHEDLLITLGRRRIDEHQR